MKLPRPDKPTTLLGVGWLMLAFVFWRIGNWIQRKNKGRNPTSPEKTHD